MKQCKRLLTLILIILLAITMQPIQTHAAAKLNATSRTLYVGESASLYVTGTTAKVKWSSTNKKVASVTQKGKVTAKQAGAATIKAKVAKKTLKCKITVQTKFDADAATKKISCTLHNTADGVVAILKNNNTVTVGLTAKLAYYSNGNIIDTASDFNYAFEAGKECVLTFRAPQTADYQTAEYDDYKITMSVKESSNLISRVSQIDINSNMGVDNISAEITNRSDTKLETVQLTCLFYDAQGHIIGYRESYAHCGEPGSSDFVTFRLPYDEDRHTIQPDHFEIYVNSAYIYTWQL